ncbi:P-loop NTPase fold protein [Chryseobacterium sp. WX]|uniref:P-loop NTPase fold protein n=1 Tax=Chryseobacterium sp. WX TaxID=3031803 RepID=UPI0024095DB9|nr:P-loop NTPase fold protein [Chryseobacterium sp. WX]WFB69106.1 hypothetical protein PZ898_06710 [Chryseobacterium sp. WX]
MSRDITINLSKSENANYFEAGEILHVAELDKVQRDIATFLKDIEVKPSEKYLHRAITILGSRGSGKTSFLLNLINYYKNNPDISVLEIIDPTLIEEKGHVFLNIISEISETVTEKFASDVTRNVIDDKTREDWDKKLMNLAGGIPSIDGIGKNDHDKWMDAEFVLETGLAAVSAARRLQKNFIEFIELSLKILDKKAFLITFDDIDVDSSKGWAVLECVRKYFTSVRLIIILSGDMNLYSTVIRQQKWANFGKEIIKYESLEDRGYKGSIDKFNKMVTDLASQYMLKIMPPQYRVNLTTIYEKKRIDSSTEISIVLSQRKKISIENVYKTILLRFGITNPTQAEVFRTFLLSLPLRSQIQFLKTNESIIKALEKNDKFISENNTDIIDIFISELHEKNVDTYTVKYSSKYINSIILNLLLSTKSLNDVYQLQPITTDSTLNSSVFALNLILSSALNKGNSGKYLVFDYMLKIAFPRNILNFIPYSSSSTIDNAGLSIENFSLNTGIFADRVLRDMMGDMQSQIFGVINAATGQNSNFYIKLLGLKERARRPLNDRLDTVFSVQNGSTFLDRALGYIPSFIITHSYRQGTQVCYSIYSLLATVGELLKRDELVAGGQNVDTRKKELESALLNLSQIRAYSAYNSDSRESSLQENNETENEDITIEENNFDEYDNFNTWNTFLDSMLEWFSSQNNCQPISVHVLGKIFTRFYYALQNIDKSINKKTKLGDLINYQIIAFFNAVIIEDTLEQLQNSPKLNLDNTNLSNRNFINNLKKLSQTRLIEERKKLTLSDWILSCPLLISYLNPNDQKLKDSLSRYLSSEIANNITKYSVYNMLNKVSLLNSNNDTSSGIRRITNHSTIKIYNDKTYYHDLVNQLKGKYSRELFQNSDKATTTLNNQIIREKLPKIFGGKNSSTKIREFRNFLEKNPHLWP